MTLAWFGLPLIVTVMGALAALLASAFARERPHAMQTISLATLATLVIAFLLSWNEWTINTRILAGMVTIDRLSLIAWMLIFAVAAFVVLLSRAYLPEGHHVHAEYYALVLFATFGMGIIVSAANLLVLIIGIEITGLASYILAGIVRYRVRCNEAAMKYFLTGTFSLAFLAMGTAFIFGATGSLDLASIGIAAREAMASDRWWFFLFGCAMLIAGIGFKIAAVPFHAWAPDVYDGAPTPITAFIAAAAKVAGFVALTRLALAAFFQAGALWITISSTLAIATMVLGNLAALAQENIKRLLAYSSIAHAGYILIAFPAMASDSSIVAPILFYLIASAFMTVGAFAVVVALNEGHEEHLGIASLAGLGKRRPAMAAALSLFLLSLAGFPPTFGFFAKYYLFLTAINAGLWWLVVIAILNTVISVYFYLRPIAVMYLHDEGAPAHEGITAQISTSVIAVIFLCALAVAFFGIFPTNLLDLILRSI